MYCSFPNWGSGIPSLLAKESSFMSRRVDNSVTAVTDPNSIAIVSMPSETDFSAWDLRSLILPSIGDACLSSAKAFANLVDESAFSVSKFPP